MDLELIPLKEEDYATIKEIYDYYIFNSTATFHTESATIEEIRKFILLDHPTYPSFMMKYENEICGYCYFAPFNKRQAYNRTAEITIYLKYDCTGKGIGKQTILKMEEIAKKIGFKVLIAGITAENSKSVLLFEKCSFEKCAHYKQVGEKFNRILDVVDYQKFLDD